MTGHDEQAEDDGLLAFNEEPVHAPRRPAIGATADREGPTPPRQRATVLVVAGAMAVLGTGLWFMAPDRPSAVPAAAAIPGNDPAAATPGGARPVAPAPVAPAAPVPPPTSLTSTAPRPAMRSPSPDIDVAVRRPPPGAGAAAPPLERPLPADAERADTAIEPLVSAPSVAIELPPLSIAALPEGAVSEGLDSPVPPPQAAPSSGAELDAIRQEVRRVVGAYAESFTALDVAAAAALWPGVDTAELARAFRSVHSQDMSVDACEISRSGARVSAACTGALTFVPRVGSPKPRRQRVRWHFVLAERRSGWLIEGVTASPLP